MDVVVTGYGPGTSGLSTGHLYRLQLESRGGRKGGRGGGSPQDEWGWLLTRRRVGRNEHSAEKSEKASGLSGMLLKVLVMRDAAGKEGEARRTLTPF